MVRISVESAKIFALTGLIAWGAAGNDMAGSLAANAEPVQTAAATPTPTAASVSAIRVGVHPGKIRIVLDISKPTDLGFEVADDGKTVVVKLPASVWKAGAASRRHRRGLLADYLYTPSESGGGSLSLFMKGPVAIERPFLVPPQGGRGYRLVIDAVPASMPPAPGPVPSAKVQPSSLPAIGHQLVGIRLEGNDQLPPDTVELAPPPMTAQQIAQEHFPPQLFPHQFPVQRLRQSPGQFNPIPAKQPGAQPIPNRSFRGQPVPVQSIPAHPGAQPVTGQIPPGVITSQQPIRTLNQASQLIDKLFYVRGIFGGIFARESEMTGGDNNNTTEYDAGFAGSAAIGIDLKNMFRAEAEVIYTNNSVKSVVGTANSQSVNTGNVGGSLITYSGMANLAMDLPAQFLLTPYVFAGVGITGVFLDGVNSSGAALYNSDDFVFAMQLGAGISMPFDEQITLEASYRFFNTFDPELQDASGTPVTMENSSHNFLFGARYTF